MKHSHLFGMALIPLFWLAFQANLQTSQELPLSTRLNDRTYPSVFMAWSPADNLPQEDKWVTVARHDLMWNGVSFYGLRWEGEYEGLATSFTQDSVQIGLKRRKMLLNLNPHLVLLAEIRHHDAVEGYLPDDSSWWVRGKDNHRIVGWAEGHYFRLDESNPQFQDQVAKQCKAVMRTGVVDGVMLDWWNDTPIQVQMVRKVRAAIGPKALIIVNSNNREDPNSAPYVNGLFMECDHSQTAQDWDGIAKTLVWTQKHFRKPSFTCLETWYHHSRNDLNLMRCTTTLSLTLSNGYCLFSDPDTLPTPDHLHDWYPFWNKSLGKPLSQGYKAQNGLLVRIFQHGAAVCNLLGNGPRTIVFRRVHSRLSNEESGKEFSINEEDGDIFILNTGKKDKLKAQ